MLILSTSDIKGQCFVETKNLDGETNLKIKCADKEMHQMFGEINKMIYIDGIVSCEKPNNAIYKFEGAAEFSGIKNKISLSIDNLLLRGSSLKNTEYIYGITIFQGHDTKVMKNSAGGRYKFSQLEKYTNISILIVFIL